MGTVLIFVLCIWILAQAFAQTSNVSYCSILDKKYKQDMPWLNGQLRLVVANEKEMPVEVWGGRGPARAAAALLYVMIRYRLQYTTSLIEKDANLCDLIDRAYMWEEASIVAPAAFMPNYCNISRNGMDRLSFFKRPVVKSDLLLFMYLSPDRRNHCASTASSWIFFVHPNEMQKCSFAHPDQFGNHSCNDCVAVLARNASITDFYVVQEYQKMFSAKKLQLILTFYESDLELREEMKKLRETNTSFLFIYEGIIWTTVEGVYHIQPPPCAISAEVCYNINSTSSSRLGDGLFYSYYSPEIQQVVRYFTPNTTALYQILELEKTDFSIEEAACYWVSNVSEKEIISRAISVNMSYNILILMCDTNYYSNVSKAIKKIQKHIKTANISNFEFVFLHDVKFNCNTDEPLIKHLRYQSREKNTIGIVLGGWDNKINSVIETATKESIMLIFSDPVTSKKSLESTSSRSSSGTLRDLAQAYHNFFKESNWRRIAIISDDTEYSKQFTEALKSATNFIWNDMTISNQTILYAILERYQKLDARIFVVNTKWKLVKQILCTATQLGMTKSNYHVWITREGNVLTCDANDRVKDIHYFSMGLECRGGQELYNYSIFETKEWIKLYNQNNNTSEIATRDDCEDFVMPFNVLSVSNAIVQLASAFTNFWTKYPNLRYVLHNQASIGNMKSSFDNTTTAWTSIAFLDKWHGSKRRLLAIWQFKNEIEIAKWLLNENIFKNNREITDRPYCMISSGDYFGPRCHDITVLLGVIALLLILAAFILARRMRLAQLARRDLLVLDTLIEHRKKVASDLNTYLVDRHSVKILHEIGSGNFGRVHFAELKRPGRDAVVVAAKEPREGIALEEERDFLHEACILAPLSHDHVIRLVGICLKDGPPMVLMEHALHLDLQRYLIERRHLALKAISTEIGHEEVSDATLTRLVQQAAAALRYLAELRLVHRDVRAANCLIDKERSLKLADFGMARHLIGHDPEYATRRRGLFPVLWMAPESLENGIFSPASDIWALGVLILEVVTLGKRPFGSWPPARVLRHVELGGHAPLPPDTSIHTRNLVTSCWQRDPESRPSAKTVEQFLETNPQALSAALLAANPSFAN